MTTVFDVYYTSLKAKIPGLASMKEVSEIEKMLKQMAFELSFSRKEEKVSLKKKYNECEDSIRDIKAKIALDIVQPQTELDSTMNETSISKTADVEKDTFFLLNSGANLGLINQISNEIEANGKDIALKLDENNKKFIETIGKVNGMNSTLEFSGKLLTNMMSIENRGKIAIGAFAVILLSVLLIFFIIRY